MVWCNVVCTHHTAIAVEWAYAALAWVTLLARQQCGRELTSLGSNPEAFEGATHAHSAAHWHEAADPGSHSRSGRQAAQVQRTKFGQRGLSSVLAHLGAGRSNN